MALVILTLMPVFALVLRSAGNERVRAGASAEAALALAARASAVEFGTVIADTRRGLATMARVPSVQGQLEGACGLLEGLGEVDPRYFSLALVDDDGGYICQTLPLSAAGVSVIDQEWFRVPRFEGRPTDQLITRGRINQVAVLVVSHPVTDAAGDVVAVIAAGLVLQELLPVGMSLAPRSGDLELIGEGLVLAESADPTAGPQSYFCSHPSLLLVRRNIHNPDISWHCPYCHRRCSSIIEKIGLSFQNSILYGCCILIILRISKCLYKSCHPT